jgi:uncharacterized damage-inducible protein DinB
MTEDLQSFVLLLDEGFDRAAWHGPSLLASLRGVTVDQLLHRPRRGVHNAWELAVHSAYWKHAVRNRILGGSRDSFALAGSNFFPRDKGLTLADWKRDRALLVREHKALRAVVADLDPGKLDLKVAGSRHTLRRTVLGIAAHDIYHAGQIALLKRLAA